MTDPITVIVDDEKEGERMGSDQINRDFGHGEKDLRVPHEPITLEDGRRIFIREWAPVVSVMKDDITTIEVHGILAQPASHYGDKKAEENERSFKQDLEWHGAIGEALDVCGGFLGYGIPSIPNTEAFKGLFREIMEMARTDGLKSAKPAPPVPPRREMPDNEIIKESKSEPE